MWEGESAHCPSQRCYSGGGGATEEGAVPGGGGVTAIGLRCAVGGGEGGSVGSGDGESFIFGGGGFGDTDRGDSQDDGSSWAATR